MDDGSKVIKNNFFYYSIATCCFTIEEHKFLRKIFKDNFDMDVALHGLKSKRKTTTVYIGALYNSNLKFKVLIEPYIIESMKYKL